MSSPTPYHEPVELLSEDTKDMHRAIVSLMEELEAIDWYQQRVDATSDESLKEVLGHNLREEIEHAMMNLEWIRRKSPNFDRNMRTYLFSEGPITTVEKRAKGELTDDESPSSAPAAAGSALGLGSLKAPRTAPAKAR